MLGTGPEEEAPTDPQPSTDGAPQQIGDESVLAFMGRMAPDLEPPTHLVPLIDEMDACIAPHKGQRFFWFSVPPRHWKTTTLRHGIVKHLQRWPNENVAYVSHTQPFANKQSRYLKRLAARCGFRFSLDANRQDEWELRDYDGGLTARGVQGFGAGLGFRLIVLDDPLKGREQAESPTERQRIWDSIEDDIIPRLTPDGCVWLVHTRWHEDDPIGRAKKQGWRGVNIKALGGEAEDQPLLPAHWDHDTLAAIRKKNPRKFASLYQGMPRPKGGSLFRSATHFDWETERPRTGFRRAYGLDFAYSEHTIARADWSVSIEMLRVEATRENGNEPDPKKARYFIVDVQRKQVDAPSFTLTLTTQQAKAPGLMRWYASGTEKGAGQFVKKKLPQLKIKNATADKYQRAQRFAEAWNEGRVLVPDGETKPEWVDDFVEEITTFTGVKDASDDQVDAGAAAFDELEDGGERLGATIIRR